MPIPKHFSSCLIKFLIVKYSLEHLEQKYFIFLSSLLLLLSLLSSLVSSLLLLLLSLSFLLSLLLIFKISLEC